MFLPPGSALAAHTCGQVVQGHYRFTGDLLALEASKPGVGGSRSQEVWSPLSLQQWSEALSNHPDKQFVDYILAGLRDGFRIGFNRQSPLQAALSNMVSSKSEIIEEYLARELSLGRMVTQDSHEGIQISPLGIIPKKNKPGKYRLIVDLSSPPGVSVNDGIAPTFSSVCYPTVDNLASLVVSKGKGAYLVKADIKEAYRNIPIHPDDYYLLGVEWDGVVILDKFLPFGLRSAPKIFSAVADAAQWILLHNGVKLSLHYLDDFIMVEGDLVAAEEARELLCSTFEKLGLPLEPSKLEGPSTCLTFLGIEVDTLNLQLRLPADKLARLIDLLEETHGRKHILKKELESLTGLLQYAAKVVRPGRAFIQRLYALEKVGSAPDHKIRLNKPARADVMWWQMFVSSWNGISMLSNPMNSPADVEVFSDASGSWGGGALCFPNWFSFKWPLALESLR